MNDWLRLVRLPNLATAVADPLAGFVIVAGLADLGWLPPAGWMLEPGWRNLFENIATVQFDHRVLAMLVLRERLSSTQVFAVALAMVAVVLLVL